MRSKKSLTDFSPLDIFLHADHSQTETLLSSVSIYLSIHTHTNIGFLHLNDYI